MAALTCNFPGCDERGRCYCDYCDRPFCEDPEHGTPGGDRDCGYGAVEFLQACPSVCATCEERR